VSDTPTRRVDGKKVPMTEAERKLVFPGLTADDGKLTWSDIRVLLSSRTYCCIVLQGCFGAFPWPGLGQLVQYFNLCSIDENISGLLSVVTAAGAAIGGGFGGFLGDRAYKHLSRAYGRVAVAHISTIVGVPCLAIFFYAFPRSNETGVVVLYALFLLVSGFLISWPPPNNTSNLTDIFSQRSFALALGLQFCAEGTISSWSPFAVGALAENVFGVTDLVDIQDQTQEWRDERIAGLAAAIFVVCALGWGIGQFFYFPYYVYYKRESREINPELASPTRTGGSSAGGASMDVVQLQEASPVATSTTHAEGTDMRCEKV